MRPTTWVYGTRLLLPGKLCRAPYSAEDIITHIIAIVWSPSPRKLTRNQTFLLCPCTHVKDLIATDSDTRKGCFEQVKESLGRVPCEKLVAPVARCNGFS